MSIVNRDRELIFLKFRKTASSSSEIHLILNSCLGKDIHHTSKEKNTVYLDLGIILQFFVGRPPQKSKSVKRREKMKEIKEIESLANLESLKPDRV